MPDSADIPDDARTTRTHAGETILDNRNWPGLILILLSVVGLGATLTAAGYGFAGWAVIAAVAGAVCLIGGSALILLEHRRVRAQRGQSLRDPKGH
ncbi:hypothetical protein [Nocardia sp. IFM 10818]